MTTALQQRLTLFIDNVHQVKQEYSLPHTLVKQLAAMLYTAKGKQMDAAHLRQCHGLLKQNTGAFSMFRQSMALDIAAMLSLCGNPAQQLENTLEVYRMMKQAKFRSSEHLAMAAYQIAESVKPGQYEDTIAQARAFYDGMKKNHVLLTGKDDYAFAVMLALSDIGTEEGLAHMEALHNELKHHFTSKNSVQALTQVLVLGKSPADVAQRVYEMRDALIAKKCRMDRQYTLASLGILALLPGSVDEITGEVAEVYDTLRKEKGFGPWSNGKQEVLLYAAALVTLVHCQQSGSVVSTALSTNITNIIIAQNTAILAAVVASSAAASSASH